MSNSITFNDTSCVCERERENLTQRCHLNLIFHRTNSNRRRIRRDLLSPCSLTLSLASQRTYIMQSITHSTRSTGWLCMTLKRFYLPCSISSDTHLIFHRIFRISVVFETTNTSWISFEFIIEFTVSAHTFFNSLRRFSEIDEQYNLFKNISSIFSV